MITCGSSPQALPVPRADHVSFTLAEASPRQRLTTGAELPQYERIAIGIHNALHANNFNSPAEITLTQHFAGRDVYIW